VFLYHHQGVATARNSDNPNVHIPLGLLHARSLLGLIVVQFPVEHPTPCNHGLIASKVRYKGTLGCFLRRSMVSGSIEMFSNSSSFATTLEAEA
jgi:hypothetical protein